MLKRTGVVTDLVALPLVVRCKSVVSASKIREERECLFVKQVCALILGIFRSVDQFEPFLLVHWICRTRAVDIIRSTRSGRETLGRRFLSSSGLRWHKFPSVLERTTRRAQSMLTELQASIRHHLFCPTPSSRSYERRLNRTHIVKENEKGSRK